MVTAFPSETGVLAGLLLQSAVDFSARADPHHQHEEHGALDLVHDAVIPDPDPVKLSAAEFLHADGVGVGPERFGPGIKTGAEFLRQRFERPERRRTEFDAVDRHRLQPEPPLDLGKRNVRAGFLERLACLSNVNPVFDLFEEL